MKLIFIYGPPASGKLTISEILSERTSIPLFHNHLSRDLVKDIYKEDLMDHYALVDTIRIDVLDYCSKKDTDLIFTYVYGGKDDDANVKTFTEIVKKNNGEVIFVELTANREDLISRVKNESRERYKKLTDPEILSKITEDMSIYSMPNVNSLKINTSELEPSESADLIAGKLGLI